MASYNLGEARGKIILETDFSSLKDGQKVLDNAKKSAEDSAQSQQQAWGKVGTAAAVGGAAVVAGFAADGLVNVLGGCCGTTPAHIAQMAKAVAGQKPRAMPSLEPALRLSGLEASVFA